MAAMQLPPPPDFSDPQGSAKRFAAYLLQGQQTQVQTRQAQLQKSLDGLDTLDHAFHGLQTALDGLSSGTRDAVQNAVAFSDPNAGTGEASGTANPGSWSFHVSQLAQAQQDQYDAPQQPIKRAGTLRFTVGGHAIEVDLAHAAKGPNDRFGLREIAAAINGADGASGEVQAQVQTVNGVEKLTLTAAHTGAKAGALGMLTLDGKPAFRNRGTVVEARDARFRIGDGGSEISQPTNTYTGIPGVKIHFTKVSSDGNPLTVTINVAVDKTIDRLQKMVDAYNALKGKLGTLTFSGDPSLSKQIPPGPFAGDAAFRALGDRLNAILQQISHGRSLPSIGITLERDNTLSLNRDVLTKAINDSPTDINSLLDRKSGIVNSLDKLLKTWTDSGKGQIKKMRDSEQQQERVISRKLNDLNRNYDKLVVRYQREYAKLGALYTRMQSLPAVIAAMLGNGK